jgi:FkbM family methyltransferase
MGRNTKQMWGRVFDLSKKELVQLDGFAMFVMADDYIGRSILKSKTYEPHVTMVVRRNLSEGGVFLDVGANIGYFTLLAASIVKQTGRVIAVEPNPQNLQLIYASMVEAHSSNIVVFPFAASDAQAILRFTTVGSNGGVVTEHSRDQRHFLLVPAVVLDHTLKDENRIDLIKIDIEAHEPIALRGLAATIERLRPRIITEFHPWAMRLNHPEDPIEYLRQLEAMRYELCIIEPSGECKLMATPESILAYWAALGSETAHLDLFARPLP